MANQKTIDKVNKLLAGRMIPLLKEGVATVQKMIDLFGSDEGKAKFGEELAGQIYAHAQTLLSQGEKYCDCDACKIARGILSDLEG